VVNLSLPASGPERQLAVYRKFGRDLQPRHVIAVVVLVSDIASDEAFSTWIRQGKVGSFDNYRMTVAGKRSEQESADFERLPKKSWLYVLGREQVMSWLPGYIPDRYRFPDGSEILLKRSAIRDLMVDIAPDDPRIEPTLASLKKFHRAVADDGGTLSVVFLPTKEEVFGIPGGATHATLLSHLQPRLQEAGISVLDLYPAVRESGTTRSPYFRVGSHFNAYGNRVVAEAFVSWFREAFPDSLGTPQ
jgi:hypothetical protein